MISFSNIQITETGTPTEPVTVDEVKAWISGLEGSTDFDTMLEGMITSARQDIENYLNLKLVDSSISLYASATKEDEEIYLFPYAENIGFLSNVVVNKIVKGEADELLVENDGYYLNDVLSFTACGKFKVDYNIDASNVSSTLKEAVKMLVAYRFANRGDNEKQMGIPEDVVSKIHPYKQTWL